MKEACFSSGTGWSRRRFLGTMSSGAAAVCAATAASAAGYKAGGDSRPNILWLSCEDTGPHLGCFGDAHAVTPNLDFLASEGVRYTNAYTVAGVCAPNRSCIITGMYPSTLGVHHMRSGGEGRDRSAMPRIPAFVKCFPEYLRGAGYYCTNNSKEDYNFETPEGAWDDSGSAAHWRNRPDAETPFFAVFNYLRTHEFSVRLPDDEHTEVTKRLKPADRRDPDSLNPPPYYPDTPIVRRRWANYYELVTAMDYWIGDMRAALEEDGLADNTIVFFWSDHGPGLPRQKRWLYDSGTRVPLMLRVPERFRPEGQGAPGTVDGKLVSSIDFAPTVLSMCGLAVPPHMQGRCFFGGEAADRRYVYGIRDRMDERYDMQRSVRDERYLYIRNYMPDKPYAQHMQSAETDPVMMELRRAASEGALPPPAELFMGPRKPVEELYDRLSDPHQVRNLAGDHDYTAVLRRMSLEHVRWVEETGDLGFVPEPELAAAEKTRGTRHAAFADPRDRELLRRIVEAASIAGLHVPAVFPALFRMAEDGSASVRYWAMSGFAGGGNGEDIRDLLSRGLDDASGTVRVACARALLARGESPRAVEVLAGALRNGGEWLRLFAATALDESGARAMPAAGALRDALNDRENKYVVRVANRALNKLFGTDHAVP